LAADPAAAVIVMPAASAPLRADERLFSYRERFYLLRRLLQKEISEGRVIISVLEKRLPKPGYTVNTLAALEKNCTVKPVIVIGADQAKKLGSWHQSEKLIRDFEFLIFARDRLLPKEVPNLKAGFVEDFAEDISATQIRSTLSALPPQERLKTALALGNPS
jgi:nicotinic acid mononucleotide adenylyltransferase